MSTAAAPAAQTAEEKLGEHHHHIACCAADRTLCGLRKTHMNPTTQAQSGKPMCSICVEAQPTSTCVFGHCPEGQDG